MGCFLSKRHNARVAPAGQDPVVKKDKTDQENTENADANDIVALSSLKNLTVKQDTQTEAEVFHETENCVTEREPLAKSDDEDSLTKDGKNHGFEDAHDEESDKGDPETDKYTVERPDVEDTVAEKNEHVLAADSMIDTEHPETKAEIHETITDCKDHVQVTEREPLAKNDEDFSSTLEDTHDIEVDGIFSLREDISKIEEEIAKLREKIASSRSKQAKERYKEQKRQREGQLSNMNIMLRRRETATLRGSLKHAMVGIQQATNNIQPAAGVTTRLIQSH